MNTLQTIFLHILNMSITASIIIAVVLLVRLPLKKAPRLFSYALWLVVLFRLICPFSFQSAFSLFGGINRAADTETAGSAITYVTPETIGAGTPAYTPQATAPSAGVPIPDAASEQTVPPVTSAAPFTPADAAAIVWAVGTAAMLLYGSVSYFRLKRRIATATLCYQNIYETDRISSPFVCGILHPCIYLPLNLRTNEYSAVLLHEQTHIRRRDHLVKPLAYLVLAVHWFNPLVWLSFYLMAKDMEMACDERVVQKLGGQSKTEYSLSLLSLSAPSSWLKVSPLAFGEISIKRRVQNILKYKKPKISLLVLALIVVLAVTAGCAANPAHKEVPMSENPESSDTDCPSETETDALSTTGTIPSVTEGTSSMAVHSPTSVDSSPANVTKTFAMPAEGTIPRVSNANTADCFKLLTSISSVSINGTAVSTFSFEFAVCTVDISKTTTASIQMTFSDSTSKIKEVKGNTDLKPGINYVTVTLADSKTECTQVCILYCRQLDEIYRTAENLYSQTQGFYWGEDGLTYDYKDSYANKHGNDLAYCANFDQVASRIFTSNGLKQCITWKNSVLTSYARQGNKVYTEVPSRGGDISYAGTVLIPKSQSADKLVYTAQSYFENDVGDKTGTCSTKTSDFVLLKQNGQWFTESFDLPN